MGYNNFRYARRIDADNIGIYHNDMTKLINLDKSTADKITLSGGYGTSTGDLIIRANTSVSYPRIEMFGNSSLSLTTNHQLLFKKGALLMLTATNASNVTTLEGGGTTGDDLQLKANTIDAGPVINLVGNGNVSLIPASGSHTQFGTHTATGDAVSNGSIEIKDAGGIVRKLMTKA